MNGIIPWGRALDPESTLATPFRGRAAGYYTMLSLRSFGSRVVPEAKAEERSRQNELVHCSQVRFANPLYSAHFAWE